MTKKLASVKTLKLLKNFSLLAGFLGNLCTKCPKYSQRNNIISANRAYIFAEPL